MLNMLNTYIEALKEAMIIFPFISILISVPFAKSQHDKFGRVMAKEAVIVYSFALYLVCAFALVIFPLPTFSEMALMNTVAPQLLPFQFVGDLIRDNPLVLNNPSTYIDAITDSTVLVVVFNILLTLPLGVYLRNYFGMSKSQTILCAFALSMFFELTQLSGLYFIFPKAYRMFDVDDLFLNTFGGLVGYAIAPRIKLLLPTKRPAAQMTVIHGKKLGKAVNKVA